MSKEKETPITAKLRAFASPAPTKRYVAIRGLNYGDPEIRIEPGQEVTSLPESEMEFLLAEGHIKPVKGGK